MNHESDATAANAQQEHHADVGAERLARVYAAALLAAADSAGQTQQVMEELDSLIDDVFAGAPRLEALFAGAAVGRKARRAALEKAFAGRASPSFYNFLLVLNEHERLDLL